MSAKQADQFLLSFTAKLKERGRLPKHIEVSSLSSGTMASIFDSAPSSVINESVFCGIDPTPATAILKGLVEMIERLAFSEGYKGGLAHCQTARSDGFAAFPLGIVPDANGIARENGLCEAIERYVWASWWDDQSIGHEIRPVDFQTMSSGESLLRDLQKHLSLDSIVEVRPWMEDSERVVLIYLAFLNPIGVISGGACGKKEDFEGIRYRAIAELLRHGLAVTRLNTHPDSEITFYERRLRFFGLTKDGTALARSRQKARGSRTIKLPRLAHDSSVPHSLSELVAVHRCHFENQPEFVGGELERLCL